MTQPKPTATPLTELEALLESDLATLYRLVNTFGVPVAEGDIRAASAILRRWLGEGLLGKLCNRQGLKPMFPVLNNGEAIAAAATHPSVRYFLTAGVRLQGAPVMFFNDVVGPPEDHPPQFVQPVPSHLTVPTKAFLDQRRAYFEGEFFTCREIIVFTANKLGGVHHDTRRDERQLLMQRASEHMTFGGPLENLRREPPGPIYLNVEPDGREMLSGFHLEIIAAATSLLNVELNGTQLVVFPNELTGMARAEAGMERPQFVVHRLDAEEPPNDP